MTQYSKAILVALLAPALALPASAQDWQSAVGASPSAPQGAADAGVDYTYDDGSTEDALGLSAGGEMAWFQWFDPVGGSDVITHIHTAVGTPAGTPPGAGGPLTVYVWDDPNNDGNPSDAVLLGQGSGVILNPSTDLLTTYALDVPVTVTSRFFIGAMVGHGVGQFPGPMDKSQASLGRAWVAGANGFNFNATNLMANNVAPLELDAIGFPAVWVLRAGGATFADLGGGLAGAGGTPVLTGTSTFIAGDPVFLTLHNAAPATTAALVIGLSAGNVPFKGGTLVPTPDLVQFGLPTGGGSLLLSDRWPAGLPSGFTAYYQFWVTDASGPAGFSASNGASSTTP